MGPLASVNIQNLPVPDSARSTQGAYSNLRPQGASISNMEEGYLRTCYIKAIESVDSYELDIEVRYKLLT